MRSAHNLMARHFPSVSSLTGPPSTVSLYCLVFHSAPLKLVSLIAVGKFLVKFWVFFLLLAGLKYYVYAYAALATAECKFEIVAIFLGHVATAAGNEVEVAALPQKATLQLLRFTAI